MSIDGADVAEAHLFKEHPTVQEPFHRVLQLRDRITRHLADDRQLVQQPVHVALEAVVERCRSRLVEILRQSAHARTNSHLVVVQNDEQVFLEFRRVVHRLEDDARGQRSVANDRDRFATALSEQVIPRLHPQYGRDARPRMARHEQVVLALVWIRETHQAPLGPDRTELREPPCDELVRIDLMPGVPDQPVLREVVDLVQREAQFDHAQVAREVSRPLRHEVAQRLANLVGKLQQLRVSQPAQIARRVNLRQQFIVHNHSFGVQSVSSFH